MAKYTPIELVKNYQGKVCQHSDTYFQARGKDKNVLCTGKICNPRNLTTNPYDSDELARQAKFAQAVAAAKALTSEAKAAYKAAFLAQDKHQFFFAFCVSQEYAKLN